MKYDSTIAAEHFHGSDEEILITGGTGTLGKALIKELSNFRIKGLRIFSRDEYKQWKMRDELKGVFTQCDFPVGFYIGDVRDYERMKEASKGVTTIINTAAMKQVPACEFNPYEAVKTNIEGTMNVCKAGIENKVQSVMHISTDKAVYPVNLYGSTKAVAEKLVLHSNVYSPHDTRFNVCRYGNVLGSRGSVIELFEKQIAENAPLTVTDVNMTRFWITVEFMAGFILNSLSLKERSCVFVPRMKSSSMMELIRAVEDHHGQKFDICEVGIRAGEKLHECLVTWEESKNAIKGDRAIIIMNEEIRKDQFSFTSETAEKLTIRELKEMIYD